MTASLAGRLVLAFVAATRAAGAHAQQAPSGPGAAASGCTTVVSRAGLAEASGARIRSVRITTHPPRAFRGAARALGRLHTRTRPRVVRRELLFAAGDTVDTLRVAESLRRLRRVGFLDDAWLTATRCAGSTSGAATADAGRAETGPAGEVDLVVRTRDAWSTLPNGNWTVNRQTAGLYEANLLGTGRAASVVLRRDANRLGDGYRYGGQVALADPALTPVVAAAASYAAFADGRAWLVAAGSRARTLADPWTVRASASQLVRDPADSAEEQGRRDRAALLVGRRLSPAEAATVVYVLGGVEGERAMLAVGAGELVVGPAAVRRSFVGPTAGVAVRAARFDTLSWLLPRRGVADLPRGVEAELVVGAGRDAARRASAIRLGGWVGRVWHPRPGSLVATDLWGVGYATHAARLGWRPVEAATVRLAATAVRSTGDGLWTARAGAERLVRPDPDARAFVELDPSAALVAGDVRLARATATAWLERSTHVWAITQSTVVDAALFAAASRRWRPASSAAGDPVTLGIMGLGVRFAPTRPGPPTAGLDVGYPVIRPRGGARGPVVRVSVTPWLGALRGR